MMKKVLILGLALVLAIAFIGCAKKETSSNQLINQTQQTSQYDKPIISEDGDCILHLGLSRADVKSKLAELKMLVTKEVEGQDDNYKPNGIWSIYSNNILFSFNSHDQLEKISIGDVYGVSVNADMATQKGLKKGDTIEKMHKLYGTEASYDKNWNMYIYKMKNCNFGVTVGSNKNAGIVTGWEIYLEQNTENNKVNENEANSDNAIEIVKKEIGAEYISEGKYSTKDLGFVTIANEGKDNEGRSIIAVRSSKTTVIINWYYVNTKTGQFKIE